MDKASSSLLPLPLPLPLQLPVGGGMGAGPGGGPAGPGLGPGAGPSSVSHSLMMAEYLANAARALSSKLLACWVATAAAVSSTMLLLAPAAGEKSCRAWGGGGGRGAWCWCWAGLRSGGNGRGQVEVMAGGRQAGLTGGRFEVGVAASYTLGPPWPLLTTY